MIPLTTALTTAATSPPAQNALPSPCTRKEKIYEKKESKNTYELNVLRIS